MIGGVLVFGGSERTTVDVGFGGITGAKDVVSATIVKRRRLRMLLLCNALACLAAKQNDASRFAQDCKAAVRMDSDHPSICFIVLWLAGLVQS